MVDLGAVLLALRMEIRSDPADGRQVKWQSVEKWVESLGLGAGLVHMFIFLRYAVMSKTGGLTLPP